MVSHKKEVDPTVKLLLQIFPEEFIRKSSSGKLLVKQALLNVNVRLIL